MFPQQRTQSYGNRSPRTQFSQNTSGGLGFQAQPQTQPRTVTQQSNLGQQLGVNSQRPAQMSTNMQPLTPAQGGRFSNITQYNPNTQQFFDANNAPVYSLGEFRQYMSNPMYASLRNEVPSWISNLTQQSPNESPVMQQARSQGFQGNILNNYDANMAGTTPVDWQSGFAEGVNPSPSNIGNLLIRGGQFGSSLGGFNAQGPFQQLRTQGNNSVIEPARSNRGYTQTAQPARNQQGLINNQSFNQNPFLSFLSQFGPQANNNAQRPTQQQSNPLSGGAFSLESLSPGTRSALGLPLNNSQPRNNIQQRPPQQQSNNGMNSILQNPQMLQLLLMMGGTGSSFNNNTSPNLQQRIAQGYRPTRQEVDDFNNNVGSGSLTRMGYNGGIAV